MFALLTASLLRQFLEINCFQRNRRELYYLFCKQCKPQGALFPLVWRRVKERGGEDGEELVCGQERKLAVRLRVTDAYLPLHP